MSMSYIGNLRSESGSDLEIERRLTQHWPDILVGPQSGRARRMRPAYQSTEDGVIVLRGCGTDSLHCCRRRLDDLVRMIVGHSRVRHEMSVLRTQTASKELGAAMPGFLSLMAMSPYPDPQEGLGSGDSALNLLPLFGPELNALSP